MPELLRAANIAKHYDGVCALRDVDFSVSAGEVHALMGENGAGKSTLAKILAGSVQADRGAVFLDGVEASIANPLDAQRLGIGIIYQELDLFPHLTVAENIAIGNLAVERARVVDFAALDAFCRPFLEQAGLACDPRAPLGELPIGQMQQVAIARALSMNARLILMDEPTSSLSGDAAEALFGVIATLKRRGVSVVYVSHKLDEIFRICDRLTVLRDGAAIGTRAVAETNIDEVIRMMVGRELQAAASSRPETRGDVLLSVAGLGTAKLRDVTFDLHRGEVLGIAGLVGAGRSELGAALFGLDRVLAGSIRVGGRAVRPRSPAEAIACGIGLLPEDRKLEGLMMDMSILENSTLAVLRRFRRGGFLRRAVEREAIAPVHERLAVKCPSLEARVASLSGGNQQKVLLSRWLLADPQALFLDDPTRGIDVGAKRDIYGIIQELAAGGKGVIFVSSELPELLACCHRILVMNGGRVIADCDAGTATQEQIMAAATMAKEAHPDG
jgi:ABC-type sugar transport system ATPase subunit